MDIYIQSRGYEQNKDYRWLKINTDDSAALQLPPLSEKSITLIQIDSPSVMLERLANEQLLLLITGIEEENRLDFLDRQIRIDAAWVGSNSEEDEKALRRLASRALQEQEWRSLSEEISQAVTFFKDDSIYGFQVSFSLLLDLVSIPSENLLSSQPADRTKKVGRISPQLKQELAEELQRSSLPKEVAPLVVVTGIKKRETLEEASVWRGLSKLVDTDDWEEYNNLQEINYQDILSLPVKLVMTLMDVWEKLLEKLSSPSQDDER